MVNAFACFCCFNNFANTVFAMFRKLYADKFHLNLGPSINGLVTEGNTKICCRGFILALLQSITANKINSEHTHDYKRLLSVCEVEIYQVTINRIEVCFLIFLC